MKTVALRFADTFAPEEGTIAAHMKIIKRIGYVWYGKLGTSVSNRVIAQILQNDNPKLLLIHSGKQDRYWAYIEKIQHDTPELNGIPEYYRGKAESFKTWFKVIKIDAAEKNVLSKCIVSSSNRPLAEASKGSMSPYFIIETDE